MRIYAKVPFWVVMFILFLCGFYLFYYQGLSLNDILNLIVRRFI